MGGPSEKILLTGALGYVGGRIANHLAGTAQEFSLRLMTRRSPDMIPGWAAEMDTASGDILDQTSLESALRGVDTVIHLAAPNEIESQNDPEMALDVNGKGTYRLLQACQAQGVTRFIYFSTFHVYGPDAKQPITETTPTRPVHPYAISHRLAEDLVNWHRQSHGMETAILRLSNGYGYPSDPFVQRWSLVFNDLCRQAVQKKSITLRSSGVQQRDFVALSDVARCVHHLLGLETGSWEDGLFNLGGDCSMSILQVAEQVASEFRQWCGEDISITTGEPNGPEDSAPVVFDIEKLKRTGFVLSGDMSQEIRGTFELSRTALHD